MLHRNAPSWAKGGNGGSCAIPDGCIPCSCRVTSSPSWGFGLRDCSTDMKYGEHKTTCFIEATTGNMLTAREASSDSPECPPPSGCSACTCKTKSKDGTYTDCKISPASAQTSNATMSCFDPATTQYTVAFSHEGACFDPPPSPPPPPLPPSYGNCRDKPLAAADSSGSTLWRDRFGATCARYAYAYPGTSAARCADGKLLTSDEPNSLPDTSLAVVETAWNIKGEDGAASACCACGGGIDPVGKWGCVDCTCQENSGGYWGSYTDCATTASGQSNRYTDLTCWDPEGTDGSVEYKSHGTCAPGSDSDGEASGCVECSCASKDTDTQSHSDCIAGTGRAHGPLACYNPGSTGGVLTPRRTAVPGAVANSCLPAPAGCVTCTCLTLDEITGKFTDCQQNDLLPHGPFTCYDPLSTGGVLVHRPAVVDLPGEGGTCEVPSGCIACSCKLRRGDLKDASWGHGYRDCAASFTYGALGPFSCFDPSTTGGVVVYREEDYRCLAEPPAPPNPPPPPPNPPSPPLPPPPSSPPSPPPPTAGGCVECKCLENSGGYWGHYSTCGAATDTSMADVYTGLACFDPATTPDGAYHYTHHGGC